MQAYVNGDDWGYYALEESFGKELVQSLGRREGVLCRYDESLVWEYWKSSNENLRSDTWAPSSTLDQFAYAPVDDFDSNRVLADPVLSEQSAAAIGLLRGFQSGDLLASEAFDAQTMGRFLAHSMLWGAGHGLIWHNTRYYYNPLTAHLEPVGYDCMPLDPEGFPTELAQYEDLEVMRAYAEEMALLCDPRYLEELQRQYQDAFSLYSSVLAQAFESSLLEPPWDVLEERRKMLAAVFVDDPPTIYAYQPYRWQPSDPQSETETAANENVTEFHIGNLLCYPVRLIALQIGDRTIPLNSDWVHPTTADCSSIRGCPM